MLPHSQDSLFEAWWIASLEEARAKTCQSRESEPESLVLEVDSSTRCVELSENLSLNLYSGKMYSEQKNSFQKSSMLLKDLGTEAKPPSFELLTWEPHINEQEYLSSRNEWRTPLATESSGGPQELEKRKSMGHSPKLRDEVSVWQAPRATDGENGGPNQVLRGTPALMNQARSMWPTAAAAARSGFNQGGGMGRVGPKRPSLDLLAKQWPTVTVNGNHNVAGKSENSGDGLATKAKAWPTATARDWKDHGENVDYAAVAAKSRRLSGTAHVWNGPRDQMKIGRELTRGSTRLSPVFVEWLMGWPHEWTLPWNRSGQIASDSLAMESSQNKQKQPSDSCTSDFEVVRSDPEHFAAGGGNDNGGDKLANVNRAQLLRSLSKAVASGVGNNFKDGKYQLAVRKMSIEDGFKGLRFQTTFVVMRATKIAVQSVKTKEVLDIIPNAVGSNVDWIQGKLTEKNSPGPGAIRRFMLDLFNEKDMTDEMYYETLAEMCDLEPDTLENGQPNPKAGDSLEHPLELAKGLVIDMETIRKETEKNKVEIIIPKWSFVKQSEEERLQVCNWIDQVSAAHDAAAQQPVATA